MGFDFDKIIDRNNSGSIKHDKKKQLFGSENALPLWVADMDFEAAPAIQNGIKKRAEHPVFGYTYLPENYYPSLINWAEKRYSWKIKKDNIAVGLSVINSINLLISLLTAKNDSVLIFTPVYNMFFHSIQVTERKTVTSSLVRGKTHYEIDFEDLQNKIKKENVKIILLCNPHNPVGRVWRKDELEKIGKIANENNIIILSDEIHGDIILGDNKFIPLASISQEISDITVTLSAPTKTFNLPGVAGSFVITENKEILNLYKKEVERTGIGVKNVFSIAATVAAYTEGEEWLNALNIYLEENSKYISSYLKENIPEIKFIKPEGTYLAWLDCRELGFESHKRLISFIYEEALVGLNDGKSYGDDGEGFVRLNFAAPKSVVAEALKRISESYKKYREV